MDRLDDTRAYYDEFSTWYERERGRGYHALIDDLEVAIATPFARGARVLEVGCGTGLILERLAPIARTARGIDLSPGMLAKARERGLDVVEGSATDLPFGDGSFDVVCSFKVLAHVEAIERALAEMSRVTAPGGTILAEFYNPHSLRFLAKRFAGPRAISDRSTEAAVFTRYDAPGEIVRLAPARTRCVGLRGVRVWTPAAVAMRVPGLRRVLRAAEFASMDSAFARFAGFVVAVYRKDE